MTVGPRLHVGGLAGADEALELAVAHAMARAAAAGESGAVVRLRRPTRPVAVFGRRDTRLPGFPAAADAARAAGFEPMVRATGGRAVAYTQQALVVDLVGADLDPVSRHDRRFEELGGRMAAAFRGFGVDARVGAVPGEYCPGAHSVNARGVVKIVGTAQRVIRGAWLFSCLVVVGDADRIGPVLDDVYRHLGAPFDPASVGSLTGEVPSLSIDEIEQAIIAAYAAGVPVTPLDPTVVARATVLARDHAVEAVTSTSGG